VDAQGRPVPDAKVAVRMLRHEFAFGTAIMANLITSQGNPDLDRYRETIEKYFNKVVFENDLKWPR
jgi:GH35 family endo-1,4-beta-xylanase